MHVYSYSYYNCSCYNRLIFNILFFLMSSLLKDIYDAYTKKDCNKMQELLISLEKKDPDNIYLKKYKQLYDNTCKENKKTEKNWKVKIWWKAIRCPHCWNYLRMNDKVKKIYKDYKQWKIKQLEFECENCWTKFIWDKHSIKHLFLTKVWIWKEITIENEKYNISSIVRYEWKRAETDEMWNLKYNEYLLVDKNWDIKYLSESKSSWSWGSEDETELSWKVIPPFDIQEINTSYIKTNKWNLKVKEIDKVKVKKIYWENTKSYTVWEEVLLYYFGYDWKDYVLEKESSASQSEVWIYERKHVNLSWNNKIYDNINMKGLFDNFNSNKIILITIASIFLIYIIPGIWYIIIWLLFLLPIWTIFHFSKFIPKNVTTVTSLFRFFIMLFMIPIFIFPFIYVGLEFFMQAKEYSNNNQEKWIYKITFNKQNKLKIYDWKITYDYGWTKDRFKEFDWIKFSIKIEKDKKILENLKKNIDKINNFQNIPKNDIYINNTKYKYNTEIIKQYLKHNKT